MQRGGGEQRCIRGNGPQRRPQRRLDRRLEEVAKAVGGGYCRLQIPSKPAPGVRGTVAGRRLGALESRPENCEVRTAWVPYEEWYWGLHPHMADPRGQPSRV